jgi:hypothetical protein
MAPQVVHRTLDGKRIHLSGELDLSRPYTSVARIALDGRLHEITSGELGAAHAWAEDLGVTGFDEEFAVQGGRLRIGQSTLRDAHAGLKERVLAAIWEGRKPRRLHAPLPRARGRRRRVLRRSDADRA